MTRALGSASPKLRSVAPAAAFATLYFVTAALTDALVGETGIAVLWPASGVYLGVLLVAPHRMWPALVCAAGVGSVAAYLHAGSSLEVSVAFAVPSSAEGFLGAVLVERFANKRFTFGGLHDLFALVVGGAVVANGLIALSAGAVAAQTFDASFAHSWLRWWSADALGIIAVAPIITASLRPARRRPSGWWSGRRLAALGGLGTALVAVQLVAQGSALLGGGGDASAQVYYVQAFLAVLLLGLLTSAAAISERDRSREELGRAREGSAEELDEARRTVVQVTAELAAHRAEVIQAGRGRERLTERLEDAERARERTVRELGDARDALAVAKQELDALSRDLGLTVADRDRVQAELHESGRALERLRAELGDALEELARASAVGRALEEELEGSRVNGRALEQELHVTRERGGALQEELHSTRQRSAALEEELHSARERDGALGDELRSAREWSAALQQELETLRADRRAMEEQLAQELEGARDLSGALEKELRGARERTDALEEELETMRRAHEEAELALEHARARFAERREQLERSLGEATEKLARLEEEVADHASELSSRYDERGTCLSASQGFAGLLGYESEELVGRAGAELLHPDDRPRLARARASRSQSTFQARLRRKTGDFVWVEVSLDPVWSGGGDRLVELRTTVRRFPLAA